MAEDPDRVAKALGAFFGCASMAALGTVVLVGCGVLIVWMLRWAF